MPCMPNNAHVQCDEAMCHLQGCLQHTSCKDVRAVNMHGSIHAMQGQARTHSVQNVATTRNAHCHRRAAWSEVSIHRSLRRRHLQHHVVSVVSVRTGVTRTRRRCVARVAASMQHCMHAMQQKLTDSAHHSPKHCTKAHWGCCTRHRWWRWRRRFDCFCAADLRHDGQAPTELQPMASKHRAVVRHAVGTNRG